MSYFECEDVTIVVNKLCDCLAEATKADEQLKTPEDSIFRYKALNQFEKLLTGLLQHLVGNFYVEAAKFKFEYERELLEREFLGFAIMNLEQLPARLCNHIVRLFHHMMFKYVYRNRCPLQDRLSTRGDQILSCLCEYLLAGSSVSLEASKILIYCMEHPALARKIADISVRDRSDSELIYIAIIDRISDINDFPVLLAIFDFLKVFLLKNRSVQNYIFNRDGNTLNEHLTKLLTTKPTNYWLRINIAELFSDLLQNRSLIKCFIRPFTAKLPNMKLFFDLLKTCKDNETNNSRDEYLRLFESFRIFILNPENDKSEETKKFLRDNFMIIRSMIEKARQIRSHIDVTFHRHEYRTVMERLHKLTEQELRVEKSTQSLQ